jgi:ADP-Ribosyltransferase in polyvalent proteins
MPPEGIGLLDTLDPFWVQVLLASRQAGLPATEAGVMGKLGLLQAHEQAPWSERLGQLASVLGLAIPGRGGFGRPPFSAVMEGGQPKRVFHGTPVAFGEPSMSQVNQEALFGPGFYFTESPKVASGYAESGGQLTRRVMVPEQDVPQFMKLNPEAQNLGGVMGQKDLVAWTKPNVRPAYLDITKPFDMDVPIPKNEVRRLSQIADPNHNWDLAWRNATAEPGGALTGEIVYGVLAHNVGKYEATQALARAGYDGITHIGGARTGTPQHRVWIAFDPKQIHSAFTPPEQLP